MKNTENIKELITLYFEGKTNAQQEARLRTFFSQEQLPTSFLEDQKLMQALLQKDEIPIPIDLEQQLCQNIDAWTLQEKQHKPYPFIRWKWMAAVAVLLIAITLPIYFNQTTPQSETAQLTQTDKEKIEEAQKALLLLSTNYNKGLQQLTLSQKTLSESKQAVTKFITLSNP